MLFFGRFWPFLASWVPGGHPPPSLEEGVFATETWDVTSPVVAIAVGDYHTLVVAGMRPPGQLLFFVSPGSSLHGPSNVHTTEKHLWGPFSRKSGAPLASASTALDRASHRCGCRARGSVEACQAAWDARNLSAPLPHSAGTIAVSLCVPLPDPLPRWLPSHLSSGGNRPFCTSSEADSTPCRCQSGIP